MILRRDHLVRFAIIVCAFESLCSGQSAPAADTPQALEAHSRLYEIYDYGRPWTELTASKDGVIELSGQLLVCYPRVPDPPTLEQQLNGMAERVDAIVLATAKSRVSGLTPRKAYLFSDWTFKVRQALKYPQSGRVSGDRIIVTRTGGVLAVDGHTLTAQDNTFPDFSIGRTYLLFLTHVLGTGAFQVGSGYALELVNGEFQYRGDPLFPYSLPTTRADVILSILKRSVQQ